MILGAFINLFWFSFLLLRIFRYRSVYNTLVSRWSYGPTEFNIDVFNLKVEIIIYTLLLVMISAETLGRLGYTLGLLSFYLGFQGPEIAPFPINITLDCFLKYGHTWEFEFKYPVYAFLMILGDLSTCMIFILMIALFVFLAYQLKTNFRSVKIFLIKSCTVLLFLFIIYIIPQT